MGRRSQTWNSSEAVRYAVDTGSMPPLPRRSFLARHKRVVLPVAAVALIGAGFLANEARRQPAATPTATLDCTSARDVWRPACRPENLQTWVAKAASVRDDTPASTGALDDAKRASTPKRVAEAAKKAEPDAAPAPQPVAPAAEPVKPARALPRVAAAPSAAAPEAPPEPVRKPEAAKPAPEPVRAAEAKPAEPQPARAAPPVEQAAKPEPHPPTAAEPPRRPAPPVKVAEEPAAASAAQAGTKVRQKRLERLAERGARREAARAALAERREEQRARALAARREEQPAPSRRLARARPAEQGVRTTAYFPPGFVQALRHYNTRYAYDY
jgi:hypothetical protein